MQSNQRGKPASVQNIAQDPAAARVFPKIEIIGRINEKDPYHQHQKCQAKRGCPSRQMAGVVHLPSAPDGRICGGYLSPSSPDPALTRGEPISTSIQHSACCCSNAGRNPAHARRRQQARQIDGGRRHDGTARYPHQPPPYHFYINKIYINGYVSWRYGVIRLASDATSTLDDGSPRLRWVLYWCRPSALRRKPSAADNSWPRNIDKRILELL
ncbi:hypothetical protein C8J57DRAFT_1245958 [Mycena rebaudengoi]|nr:hypothetical protein C8J57DRAFT_1245958 [Mycena rebaudengoi]